MLCLTSIITKSQDSLKICSIGFISNDSVEIIFTKPTDSTTLTQINNYQLFFKTTPQDNWSYRTTTHKDSLSVFYDTISNPNDSNYFKIFAFDSLGNKIDSSQCVTYIHFNTIVDSVNHNIEFVVCPPIGIQCNQFYITQFGITTVSLAPSPVCFSFIQNYSNTGNIVFSITGQLTNSCYPNYKINSATSISSDFKTVYLPIPSGTGLQDTQPAKITLYPNPSNDNIKISNMETGSIITIYNTLGETLLVKECLNNIMEINNLNPGFYILMVEKNTKKITQKFNIY